MLEKVIKFANQTSALNFLLIILALGFILRTCAWFYFGPHLFGDYGKSDFHDLLTYSAAGDWEATLNDGRIYQPVYPLLWFPGFNANFESIYIFCLHQIFSIGSILIVYLTSKKLFGIYFGLLSAFFIAINMDIIFWFSWAYADNAFYFFLSFLALTTINLFIERKLINYVFFVSSGLLAMLTRPEGLFVFLAAFFLLIFLYISEKISIKKSIFIVLTLLLFLSSITISLIFLQKDFRNAFINNFHISIALYVSSKLASNSPEEQNYLYSTGMPEDIRKFKEESFTKAYLQGDKILNSPLSKIGGKGFVQNLDCTICNKDAESKIRYILGTIGLEFIKENPIEWIKMYIVRLGANTFPSLFSPFWSLSHQLYSFVISFSLIIGASLVLFFKDPRRFLASAVTLMAFALILMINFFQREIDYRVPVSTYILFSITAPYGWYKFYTFLKESFLHND